MILPMKEQGLVFLLICAAGFVFGGIYDLFRVFRRVFGGFFVLDLAEDFLYWAFAAFFLFYVLLGINFGEVRLYMILGFIGGMILYYNTLSDMLMDCFVKALLFLTRAAAFVGRLIMLPVAALKKPLSVFIKKFRMLLKKFGKCVIIISTKICCFVRGRFLWQKRKKKKEKKKPGKSKKNKKRA